jgi:hypothetical protein
MGEPGGAEHSTAVQALYTVAAALAADHGPLSGQWWAEDDRPALEVPREEWRWHMLLPLTSVPPAGAVEQAREQVRGGCPAAARVHLTTITEGHCVELLHEGPFSEEPASLKLMSDYMTEQGLATNGLHHEIYLTPFDAPTPRTLLRQPIRTA